MRTDRLLGIVLALLRHGTMSAAALARRFEVSRRTIQRDMEALDMAGVPVVAIPGAAGGYSVAAGFVLDRRLLDGADWAELQAAVEAYQSVRGARASGVAYKLGDARQGARIIYVDFSTALEGEDIEPLLTTLEDAIRRHAALRLTYEDAASVETVREVEPLALQYTWYAWYLHAYCRLRHDWRMFKLGRITACARIGETFTPRADTLDDVRDADTRRIVTITLRCQARVRTQVLEYLRGEVTQVFENGDFLYRMQAPEGERMWFSLLLGFGGEVEVVRPVTLRARIQAVAAEISARYE